MQRSFGVIASLIGFSAVVLGAFGTHALRGVLSDANFAIYQTAVQYQFYHALALLAVALFASHHRSTALHIAGWAFTVGLVVFCGSLYLIACEGWRSLGVLAPVGGLGLMTGWLALSIAFWQLPRHLRASASSRDIPQ